MSARSRTVAAAPIRSASEAWDEVVVMISETLEPADVDAGGVSSQLEALTDIGRLLISGGHLSKAPVVLIGGSLRLEISVVDGQAATKVTEKLGKVAGAASAESWELWLPRPDSIGLWVDEAVKTLDNVSAGEGPVTAALSQADATVIAFDLAALERMEEKAQ